MRFWDSSAIVPLIIDEAPTVTVETRHPLKPFIVWWGTIVEATAAVSQRERAGTLSRQGAADGLALLGDIAARWVEVPPSEALRDFARRLLRIHGLRASDALQLAAALTLSRDDPGALEFVCRDSRLAEAAAREGLTVRAS